MQKLFIIIMLVVTNQLAFSQSGTPPGPPIEYVKLEGKQFKLDGNDFYPLIVNYNLGRTFSEDASARRMFYLSPASSYGKSGDYECDDFNNSCNDQLQDHFSKIKLMGFNAIRVELPVTYASTEPVTPNSRYFSVTYDKNMGPGNQYLTSFVDYTLDISSNFNDANSTNHFNLIKNLLTQAEIADLKVILVCGQSYKNPAGDRIMWLTYDSQAASEFAIYLGKLASEISSYPSLLAYDFINEPIYQNMYKDESGHLNSKQTLCDYVKRWVDAVHQYDNNHLVTMGSAILDEVFYFDPGIMKLDFYSAHLYTKGNPMYPKFNVMGDHGIQNGFDRFDIITYWMSQTYPMPWIIGETGFSADDNTLRPLQYPLNLNNDPIYHKPPWMYGSEQQQLDYAQHSLNIVRDAGASGYAWWAFQNVFWANLQSDNNYYQENYWGLLYYGDQLTNTWYDKPAVDAFDDYISLNGHTVTYPSTFAKPPHYYDPYEIAANCSTCVLKKVQGKVIDQKGNNVENAVVIGKSWKSTIIVDQSDPLKNEYSHDISYTFTDIDGNFTVMPYNYEQQDDLISDRIHRIVRIEITSIAGECLRVGPDWPYGDQQMANPGNIILNKFVNGYDASAKNETVYVDEVRNYYGRNTLTASNLELNGSSNLTARKEVNINDEFRAQASITSNKNNETHIYISDAFPDCSPILLTNLKVNNAISLNVENEVKLNKEIEIKFSRSQDLLVDVFPNPSQGIFNFAIQNPLQSELQILVTNLIGETILILNENKPEFSINFELLPKGIYYIQFSNRSQWITKKIILN